MSQVVGSNSSHKPITNTAWVRAQLCKLQKGCTRLATASDKVYRLLAQGRWFSPGTPASSTTNTGRHDIAEILLKVALNTKNSNSKIQILTYTHHPSTKSTTGISYTNAKPPLFLNFLFTYLFSIKFLIISSYFPLFIMSTRDEIIEHFFLLKIHM